MAFNFNLSGLAKILPENCSRFMKVMGPNYRSDTADDCFVHALTRGFVAKEQVRKLQRENLITDPDARMAMGALSMVGGGLSGLSGKQLKLSEINLLISSGLGGQGLDPSVLGSITKISPNELMNEWPDANEMPVQPLGGSLVYDPLHWESWMKYISANRPETESPQEAPSDAVPAPAVGELHPWALAGYLNINLTTGNAVPARTAHHPAVLEALVIIMMRMTQNQSFRNDIFNFLSNGIAIVMCGSHTTTGNIRKLSNILERETKCKAIIKRSVVERGWNFLSRHWQKSQDGPDFEALFKSLGAIVDAEALRISVMRHHREFWLPTGAMVLVRAIHDFQDFPWQELADIIRRQTGQDELQAVSNFLEYIDPPAAAEGEDGGPEGDSAGGGPDGDGPDGGDPDGDGPDGGDPAGGGGAGGYWPRWWEFRRSPQRDFNISNYCNLVYTAVQLTIVVGGDTSLRSYQGLHNELIASRIIIDGWVQKYESRRQYRARAELLTQTAPAAGALASIQHHII